MDPFFWQGKNVLLTGHTGFKGSWLALWLQALGANVTGLALAPHTTPNLFDEAVSGARGICSIIGDIREPNEVATACEAAQPEIIFHLAAQALVRFSYQQPVDTFGTNVMGTVNILDSARHAATVRAIVVVTSDKCYANREWCWAYREEDSMGGHDPYSASKGCTELVTASYRDAFFKGRHGAGVATARAGNVIGGGDWAEDRLIPDIVRALVRQEKVQIRNPHAIRPWQHVLEPLAGYLLLAERLYREPEAYAEPWNFGPAETGSVTVGEISDFLMARWPHAPGWSRDAAAHPHETHCLRVDAAKARTRLGWSPQLDAQEALDWTIDWYARHHAAESDPLALVMEQIDRYTARQKGEALLR